ncbi:MAG TPA: ArsA-related P-loop ATPase, partial [Solirubrobacterales bacterium]|nr:ArsA-related P-loop ATPase [Solirubrobacterales bacterium]
TTLSAALALLGARLGRRVLVLTIDPARRLADALGLEGMGHAPQRIAPEILARLGVPPEGELSAAMLDMKRTFDELVARFARSDAERERILRNPIYQHVSDALAGSAEYSAMEKVYQLSESKDLDLVVLDTPPTRHALDFLEAPDRMMSFLDTSVLRFFLKPYFVAGRLTLKIATRTGALALSLVDKYLGLQFLQDLSEFFLAFEGLYDGFKDRAARVFELLRDPNSGFVLVASPAHLTLEEALYFHRRLAEKKMPFVSLVVNRLHPDPAGGSGVSSRAAPRLAPAFAEKLVAVHRDLRTLARSERRGLLRLEVDAGVPPILVPELETDVHDLRGLAEVAGAIFGTMPLRARRRMAAS